MLTEQATGICLVSNIPKLYAKDAMIRPLFFYESDPVGKVLDKLKREDQNVCIVVDRGKRFRGEIEDLDILRIMAHTALNEPITRLLDRAYNKGLAGLKAGDLARYHRNTVTEDTPINMVLKRIYRNSDNSIVVLRKDRTVAGIITQSSLLRLLNRY